MRMVLLDLDGDVICVWAQPDVCDNAVAIACVQVLLALMVYKTV